MKDQRTAGKKSKTPYQFTVNHLDELIYLIIHSSLALKRTRIKDNFISRPII